MKRGNGLSSYHLEVRDADIEATIHVGVPDDSHISDIHGAKVTLHGKYLSHASHVMIMISYLVTA